MPKDAPEVTPPTAETVAAAQQVPVAPPPPPEPDEPEPLPDGDTFDRPYVEGLREENAKWRTRTRDIESSFEGYTPEEKAQFLALAHNLTANPEEALEQFEGVTTRLRKKLGKDVPVTPEATPVPAVAPEPEPVLPPAPVGLTEEDVNRMVSERLQADEDAKSAQREIDATLAEAEAIDDRYKDPVAKAQLFAAAQANRTDLAGAHEILSGSFSDQLEAAVDQRLADLAAGKRFPPRIPVGDPTTTKEPERDLSLDEARRLADARIDAALNQQG